MPEKKAPVSSGTSRGGPVIDIRGARTHNLKNISLSIPRHQLVVITGLSGSGKSSLAFDTIFAEGQRRYMESLSSYAKQYVDLMDKPDVESITGLTPAIAIDQKTNTQNPRSTVGTATEIYDLLRLLFARAGVPHCPHDGEPMKKKSAEDIVADILAIQKPLSIIAPLYEREPIADKKVAETLARAGFTFVIFDGVLFNIREQPIIIDSQPHSLALVIAQDTFTKAKRFELQRAVKKALDFANGFLKVAYNDQGPKEKIFSTVWSCPQGDATLAELEPKFFSFNSPQGACPDCHGLGAKLKMDPDLILNEKLSINEGAIRPWPKNNSVFRRHLEELAAAAVRAKFALDVPIKKLKPAQRNILFYGEGAFRGIITLLEERYTDTESASIKQELEQYMKVMVCPTCLGKRLRPEYLAVTIGHYSIADIAMCSITGAGQELDLLLETIDATLRHIAEPIITEIKSRLAALVQAGLSYVTVDRTMNSLSGGEAQRVKLATQLASNLVNVTYILDEPSVGLHPKDITMLVDTLKKLRDLENTVIVVEHDDAVMAEADYLIDIGPGAGAFGGQVMAAGTPEEVRNNRNSLTGQYLAGTQSINIQTKGRPGSGNTLSIVGASEHNLKDVTVHFPLGKFIALTGVSGSGKSTLMTDILSKALAQKFYRAKEAPGEHERIDGLEHIDKVITIDQSPIGRTPRSNPATYTGAFTHIRELFAGLPEAQIRNLDPSHFSFNVVGGRCEVCGGDGYTKIDMQFLADVYVKCKACGGTRYKKEILDIYYEPRHAVALDLTEKNIAEILDMAVVDAKEFFKGEEQIVQKLDILDEVGLGYVKLGQPANTLSGGEAQRVKLATELSRRDTGKTLYILDEPTTGLHFDDIKKLLTILNKLVDKGNTVLIIEHNLDVIKSVDWIIDMGPSGGDEGGFIVAEGTPKEVVKVKESFTGQYLKKVLKG